MFYTGFSCYHRQSEQRDWRRQDLYGGHCRMVKKKYFIFFLLNLTLVRLTYYVKQNFILFLRKKNLKAKRPEIANGEKLSTKGFFFYAS